MKVCFFADASSIHTRRWIKYLKKREYDICLITPAVPHIEEIKGVNIYRIHYFHSLDTIVLYSCYIKWLIHKMKPDILHGIFLSNCGFYAALSGFQPFLVTALGSDVLVAPEKSSRRLGQVKYTLKKARVVTVDAHMLKRKLVEMNYPEAKIRTVLFGVESSLLLLGRKNRNSQILSCRSLDPLYNVDIIIKAYLEAKKTLCSSKLVVVGDISQRPELYCNDPNIEYHQPMPFNELTKCMINSELFISIPSTDASSVSLLEAMAVGVFPIVSDIPANREWIKDGYNGLLVPPRDPHVLADRIIEAMKKPTLREKAFRINKKIIKRKALFENNMQKLEKIYRNLVK